MRIVLPLLGSAAVLWAVFVAISIWGDAKVVRMASRVVYGEPFKADDVLAVLKDVEVIEEEKWCRPAAIRAAAIIRVRHYEMTVAVGERDLIEARLEAARSALDKALRCVPTDSFLWLSKYWLAAATEGFRSDLVPFLAMSYQTGPNEGWIAAKRARLAIGVYLLLTAELQRKVVQDFYHLVRDGLWTDATAVLVGPGWSSREVLLGSLRDLPESTRYRFAKIARAQNRLVAVPGVNLPAPRPWN